MIGFIVEDERQTHGIYDMVSSAKQGKVVSIWYQINQIPRRDSIHSMFFTVGEKFYFVTESDPGRSQNISIVDEKGLVNKLLEVF